MTADMSSKDSDSKMKDDKAKVKKDKETPQTKIVIRRLPPSFKSETFFEQISPVPEHDYFYFAGADMSLGQAFSTAYINFVSHEDVFIFTEKFDNYIFVDEKGNEFPAVVEFAPFQKVPKKKPKKADSRKGTIEQDSDYIKFLELLENPPKAENVFTPEHILEEIEAKEKQLKANHGVLKVSTPLLEFLKKKKEEKKQYRDKYREDRKKRDEERRKKREEDRKKKRDRERERQREKEKEKQRFREKENERERERQKQREKVKDRLEAEDPSQPMKLLIKQNQEKRANERSDGDSAAEIGEKKSQGNRDTRPKNYSGGDYRNKDRERDKEQERRERDRKRREKEDEEERKWRERERERKERREREKKEREKKERERRDRDRERRERERKERELEKERKKEEQEKSSIKEDQSDRAPKVDIRSILKVDVMKESTSSIEDQPSSSDNTEKGRDSDRRSQRQKARYKDRPERQIYNPGQRAAERRKQMEARSKESTPELQGQGESRGHREGKNQYNSSKTDRYSEERQDRYSSHRNSDDAGDNES